MGLREETRDWLISRIYDLEAEIERREDDRIERLKDIIGVRSARLEDIAAANQIEAVMSRLINVNDIYDVRKAVAHLVMVIRTAEERQS